MLGEVVVNQQRVFAVVPEELAHGASRVGGDELKGRRIRGGRADDAGVVHGAEAFQLVHDLRNCGLLLADGHIEAEDRLIRLVGGLLVDDRVDGESGLAGLAVADDQLPLPPADRDHRVDRLDSCLHRFLDGLTNHDSRRLDFDAAGLLAFHRPLSVQGLSEGIEHPSDNRIPYRDLHDPSGPLDRVALLDVRHLPQDRGAHVVLFEVQHHPEEPPGKLDEFPCHDLLQTVDPGDSVANGEDDAGFTVLDRLFVVCDLLLDDCADLFCTDSDCHGYSPFMLSFRVSSWVLTDPSKTIPSTLQTTPPRISSSTVQSSSISFRNLCSRAFRMAEIS